MGSVSVANGKRPCREWETPGKALRAFPLANQANRTPALVKEWFAGDSRMIPTPFWNGSRMVHEWERNQPRPIRVENMVESVSEASYRLIGVRRALCNFGLSKISSAFR